MKEIYKTITTTRGHKENGSCKKSDFGSITLLIVSNEEAPLVCNIRDFQLNQNLRFFEGDYYVDSKKHISLDLGNKQGRLTDYTSIRLIIALRKKESDDSCTRNRKFILVGKRIYEKWCKKSDLCITQTGNMTFSSWWTLDVEPKHGNKFNKKFNKKNFERELKGAREHYNKYRNKKESHDQFSYPKIKWFNEDLI